MLKSFFARLFGRQDYLRLAKAPHHSTARTQRPYDAVTWPTQMPTRRFKYNDSI
jgi:hypothetical protein